MSWFILNSNQNYHIYWTFWKHFERRNKEAHKNGCFHWTLISPSLKLNCWAQLRELIPICQYATTYINPQNLTWMINFRSRILLADAYSKHILIILTVDSQNFRKFLEWFLNLSELGTWNRREFQQDEHFESSEFHIMGWGYYKWYCFVFRT